MLPPPPKKSLLYLELMVASDIGCLSVLLYNLLKEWVSDQDWDWAMDSKYISSRI